MSGISFKQAVSILNEALRTANNVVHFSETMSHDTDKNLFTVKCDRMSKLHDEVRETYRGVNLTKLGENDLSILNELIDSFSDTYDRIMSLNLQLKSEPSLNDSPSQRHGVNANIKLPALKVPTFNGDLSQWTTFYQMFRSLVNNNAALSDIQKFQYLLSALSNEPLSLIKHLPLVGDNYKIALDILTKRYENKRLLIYFYWNGIFNAERCSSNSVCSLRNLITAFSENITALKTFDTDMWDFTLSQLLLQKLDHNMRSRFEMQYAGEIPSYTDLHKFLEKQCKALETMGLSQGNVGKAPSQNTQFKKGRSAEIKHSLVHTKCTTKSASNHDLCSLCKANHRIFKCDQFLSKTPQERFAFAKEQKLCVNCLNLHSTSNCKSSVSCRICSKRHHTILHFPTDHAVNLPVEETSTSSASLTPQVVTNAVSSTTVLLSTAIIAVRDSAGNFRPCHALIDNGSMSSFISDRCCKKLGLSPSFSNVSIEGIGQVSPKSANQSVSCQIKPMNKTYPVFSFEALVLPSICSSLPSVRISLDSCPHLQGLTLADPNYGKPKTIEILLGSEIYAQIMRPGLRFGSYSQPTAFATVFGWVLAGKTDPTCASQRSVKALCASQAPDIESTLKSFWELESIPCQRIVAPDDLKCEEQFSCTHFRD